MGGSERRAIRKLRAELARVREASARKDEQLARAAADAELKDSLIEDMAEQIQTLRKTRDEVLDDILANPKKRKALTGFNDDGEYERLERIFIRNAMAAKDRPLLREDKAGPGNRSALQLRHIHLLLHIHERRDPPQEMLAVIAGVSQSTACKMLRQYKPVLEMGLPTPDRVASEIASCRTPEEFMEIVPDGKILVDGSRFQVEMTEENSGCRSGFKREHDYNVIFYVSIDWLILYATNAIDGNYNDIQAVRMELPKFGPVTDSMTGPSPPEYGAVILYSDKGFEGINKDPFPGVISMQPKKKPRNGRLTDEEEEYGTIVSFTRVRAEHAIGRVKFQRRMAGRYVGSRADFDLDKSINCGIVNHHIMWKNKKYRKLLDRISR